MVSHEVLIRPDLIELSCVVINPNRDKVACLSSKSVIIASNLLNRPDLTARVKIGWAVDHLRHGPVGCCLAWVTACSITAHAHRVTIPGTVFGMELGTGG